MQPGFLTRWSMRLAAFLRSVVRALERLSGLAPADERFVELAARYPGAPEHWLHYIAARAPRLANPNNELPHEQTVSRPDNRAESENRSQKTPVPPLRLASAATPRRPSPVKFVSTQQRPSSAKPSLAKDREVLKRPFVLFFPVGHRRVPSAESPLPPRPARGLEDPSIAATVGDNRSAIADAQKRNDGVRAARRADLRTGNEEKQPSEHSASLPNRIAPKPHFAAHARTSNKADSALARFGRFLTSPKMKPSTYAPSQDTGAATEPDLEMRPQVSGNADSATARLAHIFTAWKKPHHRASSVQRADMADNDNVANERRIDISALEMFEPRNALQFAGQPRKSSQAPRPAMASGSNARGGGLKLLLSPKFSRSKESIEFRGLPAQPAPPRSGIQISELDTRWPGLPAIVETVPDSHIEPPRLSQLRREQEEGLWSA